MGISHCLMVGLKGTERSGEVNIWQNCCRVVLKVNKYCIWLTCFFFAFREVMIRYVWGTNHLLSLIGTVYPKIKTMSSFTHSRLDFYSREIIIVVKSAPEMFCFLHCSKYIFQSNWPKRLVNGDQELFGYKYSSKYLPLWFGTTRRCVNEDRIFIITELFLWCFINAFRPYGSEIFEDWFKLELLKH